MPIEILIAPAAPAAEAAGNFWKYGLPVVSLIAGILLKWGLDLALEGRRDAAQAAKRMVERRDSLKARQTELERSNLLALQILLARHVRGLFVAKAEAEAAMEKTGNWKVERSGPGGKSRERLGSRWPLFVPDSTIANWRTRLRHWFASTLTTRSQSPRRTYG